MVDFDKLLACAVADPGLNEAEKAYLQSQEVKKDLLKFLSGATGASIAVALAKYAKLGKIAQTILGLAGFGAGKLLYNWAVANLGKQEDRQFSTYNVKLKTYEINRNA